MAVEPVELLLEAKDQAGEVINKVTGDVLSLKGALEKIVHTAGPIGIATAAVVGLGSAATAAGLHLSETVRDLERMSQRTGVNVEDLQVFRQVIENAGGDAEGFTVAMTRFGRAIATGNPYLKEMNVNTRDIREAFMQVAGAFEHGTDTAKKADIALSLFGRSGGDFIALLPMIAHEFEEVRNQMDESGSLIKEEMTPAIMELHHRADELGIKWKGVMVQMQEATLPVAEAVVGLMNALFDVGRLDSKSKQDAAISGAIGQVTQLQQELTKLKGIHPDDSFIGQLLGKGTEALNQQITIATKRLHEAEAELEDAVKRRGFGPHMGPDATPEQLRTTDTVITDADAKRRAEERAKAIEKLVEEFRAAGESAQQAQRDAERYYDTVMKGSDLAKKGQHDLNVLNLGPEETARVEALEKKAKEIERVFGLAPADARSMATGLRDAADEAERLRAAQDIDPERAEAATRIERLAVAYGDTRTHAHQLLMDVLGIREVGKDRSQLDMLIQTDAAMQKIEADQRRREQTARQEVLLVTPGVPEEVRRKTAHQLTQDTISGLRQSTAMALTSVAVVRESLSAMQYGLDAGFGTVFSNLTNKMQTWGSAAKEVWRAVANAGLQELGRLTSSAVFRLLLDVLQYAIPGVRQVAAVSSGGGGGGGLGVTDMVSGAGSASALRGVTNINVNLSTLDTRAAREAFTSPRSDVRTALRQMAAARAY